MHSFLILLLPWRAFSYMRFEVPELSQHRIFVPVYHIAHAPYLHIIQLPLLQYMLQYNFFISHIHGGNHHVVEATLPIRETHFSFTLISPFRFVFSLTSLLPTCWCNLKKTSKYLREAIFHQLFYMKMLLESPGKLRKQVFSPYLDSLLKRQAFFLKLSKNFHVFRVYDLKNIFKILLFVKALFWLA